MNAGHTWVSYKRVHEYFEMDYREAVTMHDALTDRLKAEEREYWNDLYEQRRHRRGEWWDWYNRYLQCDEWQALRQRVFERDGGICRHTGCTSRAEQVHHLTYDRVGYELLEDLVAVCAACHERTHR